MGDGLLAEFGSVVDALECAVEVQRDMARRNEAVSEEHRIHVRIGITLGDVIVEGEDRHGEGVNIAARLQQLAEPGGIAVSRAAYEQARNKLEGSIQRSADQVRINAQLIDATTAAMSGPNRFDGSLTDVFALQTKVTRSIADALAIRLTAAEQQTLGDQETTVPAAYDAFLRAWGHIRQRTPADYAAAVPYLEDAIKLDPDYGRAYAALAWVYLITANRGWSYSLGIAVPEVRTRGLRYIAEAEKRPTTLSHQAEGLRLWDQERHEQALQEFKEAIELNSGDALSYAYLSLVLTTNGRPAEAMPHIRTAMRLDPAPGRDLRRTRPQEGSRCDACPLRCHHRQARRLSRNIDSVPTLNLASYKAIEQLQAGLRAAGVPASLAEGAFARVNRLKADEVRALLFGHTLHGRTLWNNEELAASFAPDGAASFSGTWGTFAAPPAQFDGDDVCRISGTNMKFCASIYRIPAAPGVDERVHGSTSAAPRRSRSSSRETAAIPLALCGRGQPAISGQVRGKREQTIFGVPHPAASRPPSSAKGEGLALLRPRKSPGVPRARGRR
jgi:tetratricopeptide (TPR) repeat protein